MKIYDLNSMRDRLEIVIAELEKRGEEKDNTMIDILTEIGVEITTEITMREEGGEL